MTETDGLGRGTGERLVDQATGAVDAATLREYAALLDVLEEHAPGMRWGWQRFVARVGFALCARVARDVAEQVEASGLPMRVVREQMERDVRLT